MADGPESKTLSEIEKAKVERIREGTAFMRSCRYLLPVVLLVGLAYGIVVREPWAVAPFPVAVAIVTGVLLVVRNSQGPPDAQA